MGACGFRTIQSWGLGHVVSPCNQLRREVVQSNSTDRPELVTGRNHLTREP